MVIDKFRKPAKGTQISKDRRTDKSKRVRSLTVAKSSGEKAKERRVNQIWPSVKTRKAKLKRTYRTVTGE